MRENRSEVNRRTETTYLSAGVHSGTQVKCSCAERGLDERPTMFGLGCLCVSACGRVRFCVCLCARVSLLMSVDLESGLRLHKSSCRRVLVAVVLSCCSRRVQDLLR